MTNPNKTDVYYTTVKAKYLKGLVSNTTSFVKSSAGGTTYYCTKALEFVDNAGTTYYIPLFTKGN